MKYRKGDVVSLNATVLHNLRDGDGYLYVEIEGALSQVSVDPTKAHLVSTRIEVGDIVNFGGVSAWNGSSVVAISDGKAWIRSKSDYDAVCDIGELTRSDTPKLEAAE